MTILVFGKAGQVGRELQSRALVVGLGRDVADLSHPDSCVAAIEAYSPRVVINAAAYTAVDKAEKEERLATLINGVAPGAMAVVCAKRDIPFVHISTDYVFDGSGDSPWCPYDRVSPISSYGRSKLAGEAEVAKAGGRYAILRTSWVFSAHGQNFVKTMMRLGSERDQLKIVADQIGGPTSASSIAAACLTVAEQLAADPSKAGIYHFACAPDISWAGFAHEIFAQAQIGCEVEDITSSEYPTPARRPQNSRLDCGSTEAAFGITRPNWRSELRAVLTQISDKEAQET